MIPALVAVGLLLGVFTLGALFGAAITDSTRRDEQRRAAVLAAMARHPAGKRLPVREAEVLQFRRPS